MKTSPFLSILCSLFVLMACGDDADTSVGTGDTAGGGSSATDGATTGGAGGAGSSSDSSSGSGGAARKWIGDPCTEDAQCPSIGFVEGYCFTGWPGGGYCATSQCDGDLVCPDSSTCAAVDGVDRCLVICFNEDHCRDGYRCDPAEGVCVPAS